MENTMISIATEYAERGWKVLPLHSMKNSSCTCENAHCASAAKHPRVKEWQKSDAPDAAKINEWWSRWPDANIGIATGNASRLFVVDIDPRHNGKESFQKLIEKFGVLPKTLTTHTGGGGFHLFFRTPNESIPNRTGILPGIDIRGDGGYIVAPPSIHSSGKPYTWASQKNTGLIVPPHWLIDLILKRQKSYTHSHYQVTNSVMQGGRNSFLTSEAGKLRRHGLDMHQLVEELRKVNLIHCVPPLDDNELFTICASVARYPSGSIVQSIQKCSWSKEPAAVSSTIMAPAMSSELLPECFKPWVMDISERMQVAPEFVVAPALVSFSSVVGRKISIRPKQHDNWLVVPNLWGMIVSRPGYFKSPTIAEAMKPLESLSAAALKQSEENSYHTKANQAFAYMQIEVVKEALKKAVKDGTTDKIDELKIDLADLEREAETARNVERRYKTNDATVEKIARLLNENPNGLLLLRDELNGWLQLLNKAGREGDREFFLESWNGYGSYTVDRVGAGTIHVPSLCLSVFGGIQPGKLQAYVEKATLGHADDDGLLQRFQILIYPETSPDWENVDRSPDLIAQEKAFEIFRGIDEKVIDNSGSISAVNFCPAAQDLFNQWRRDLEKKLRSEKVDCPAFESHLAKYRSLMPSLSLLFWLLEKSSNLNGDGAVSLQSATKAIEWCDFLEKHAQKAYSIAQNAKTIAAKRLAQCIEKGMLTDGMTVRSIYRNQWATLKTPQIVEGALETLEELGWLRVVSAIVPGGRTRQIELHPQFREIQKRGQHDNEIQKHHNGTSQDHSDINGATLLGANHH